MKRTWWPPAIVLSIGAVLATLGVQSQRSLLLREPLATAVPGEIEGYGSRDIELTPAEIEVAGVTSYLSRLFTPADTAAPGARFFAVYVGYYDRQTSGKTIHSPKNCLPGAGWEPLMNQRSSIATDAGPVQVNRWLIQKGTDQALVLYWYQGRGRVQANEYAVKWDLVRDAALRRRSEEALVRIVVPIRTTETDAFDLASRIARRLVASLETTLPV